jgi:hypothetical protein
MRLPAALALVVAAALITAAPAGAEVPDASCSASINNAASGPGNLRYAQTFTAVNSGTLTRAEIAIQRQAGSNGDYLVQILTVDGSGFPTNTVLAATTIVDASVPDGPSTLAAVFASPVEVVAGQQYAVMVTRPGSTDLRLRISSGGPCAGQMFASANQTNPFSLFLGGGHDMVFATFVEPPAAAAADTTAPDTTITGGPKSKEKKGKATFTFTSDEAAVTFECSLDGGPFEPCTSPHEVKVKKGKHTLAVRARDAAGNADGSPATRDWKVQKKKRKR